MGATKQSRGPIAALGAPLDCRASCQRLAMTTWWVLLSVIVRRGAGTTKPSGHSSPVIARKEHGD